MLDNVITCVNDNAAVLTTKGLTPATIAANLTTIKDDLGGKKTDQDKQKTTLAVSQQAFAKSAAGYYTAFSDIIDNAAGALGKKTPAGKQVLHYRHHVTGSDQHASPQPATAPTVTK